MLTLQHVSYQFRAATCVPVDSGAVGGGETSGGGSDLLISGIIGFPTTRLAWKESSCSSWTSGNVETGYVDGDGE